jgi:hypothetical protein
MNVEIRLLHRRRSTISTRSTSAIGYGVIPQTMFPCSLQFSEYFRLDRFRMGMSGRRSLCGSGDSGKTELNGFRQHVRAALYDSR